jgi:1-acyl-sn-glycerol-3-phosphate acyltransferase
VSLFIDPEISERVDRLELPFNRYGVDPYGTRKDHLARLFTVFRFLYKHYFTLGVEGIHHVPGRGRAMLVGNHSGGVALDGAMVITTCFFEIDPPRLAQGMAEKFMAKAPFMGLWATRSGQLTGLVETAEHLLADERLLMIFPEGARGTAKLYPERNTLVHFGSGFMRLAMQTKTPIIPFGFVGGGEAIPTIANSVALGRLLGVPYVPITPWGLAIPVPARLELTCSEPMTFDGTGTEEDEIIEGYVEQVKQRIAGLIEAGRQRRRKALSWSGGAENEPPRIEGERAQANKEEQQ